MPENESPDDPLAEYVLGQMDPRAKAEFEARLAASPALRAEVQELETACEALALTAPQVRPSKRVWSRIAERTIDSTREEFLPAGPWRHWLRLFWRGGWAVAAFLALAWLLRDRTDADPSEFIPPPVAGESDSISSNRALASGRTAGSKSNLAGGASGPSDAATHSEVEPPESPGNDDLLRMRAWVQQLATEVADLNRKLARETTLPPGANRFQVFRLAPTNSSSAFGLESAIPRLQAQQQRKVEQWLAGVLANQLWAFNDPLAEQPAPNPDAQEDEESLGAQPPPGGDTVTNLASIPSGTASSTFEVLELAAAPAGFQAPPLSDFGERSSPGDASGTDALQSMGLGFYSPDTGRGSLTLVLGSSVSDELTLQVWALDNESGGSISLGTTGSSGVPMLIRFSMDPTLIANPGFLVTLEPLGGSQTPTGPIVVRPPSSPFPTP